jgi:hypothetical protein
MPSPAHYLEVVLLRDFEELTIAEIAERLGEPTGAVKGCLAIDSRQRCRFGCCSPGLTFMMRAKSTATTALMSATLNLSVAIKFLLARRSFSVVKNCIGMCELGPLGEANSQLL